MKSDLKEKTELFVPSAFTQIETLPPGCPTNLSRPFTRDSLEQRWPPLIRHSSPRHSGRRLGRTQSHTISSSSRSGLSQVFKLAVFDELGSLVGFLCLLSCFLKVRIRFHVG
jgi:hypothetical protein